MVASCHNHKSSLSPIFIAEVFGRSILPLAFISPVNVETPITLRLPIPAFPATSKVPFASIVPVNVETPLTNKLSSAITSDLNVETPVT